MDTTYTVTCADCGHRITFLDHAEHQHPEPAPGLLSVLLQAARQPRPVEALPLPWRHTMGDVVAVEYPADRPRVVDLVLSNGYRTAETRGALYALGRNGVWDYPRHVEA